jgi:hypothetical protein
VTWVFIFQKRKEKNKHLKPTNLLNYLNRLKQKYSFEILIIQKKSDQIVLEEVVK